MESSFFLIYFVSRVVAVSSPFTIHANANLIRFEHIGERIASVLRPLVTVEYLRFAIAIQRFLKRIHTEAVVEAV